MLAEVEGDLLRDSGNIYAGSDGNWVNDFRASERIVGSACGAESRLHGQAQGAGKVIEPDGAVGEAAHVVGRGGICALCEDEYISDVAVAVTEDVDGVVRRGCREGCDGLNGEEDEESQGK